MVKPDAQTRVLQPAPVTEIQVRQPTLEDGGQMWRIARDSQVLDLNSSYAYLLYCRDFAPFCRVAVAGERLLGFVLGHQPSQHPETVFVWQVAVDAEARGGRVAGRMLDDLVAESSGTQGIRTLETTITADNTASQRLFASFARRHGAELTTHPLFLAEHFPDGHDPEHLHRIGPLDLGPD